VKDGSIADAPNAATPCTKLRRLNAPLSRSPQQTQDEVRMIGLVIGGSPGETNVDYTAICYWQVQQAPATPVSMIQFG
jgi:hypothetical protein